MEYHNRIVEEIDKHIPVTAVCSIDEMASRLMNNETSMERIAEIARSIKAGLAKNIGEYIKCSIGVSSNKYLAKVATDLQKPDGFTVLHPKDLSRLLTLQLRDLPGIGHNMEQRLNRCGIYDVETLMTHAPKHMRAIWGSIWGEKMWYLLRGHELPEEETQRSSIGHSHVLSPENRPPAMAVHVARRLTLKAAARLRRMKLCATRFLLSVRIENGPRMGFEAPCVKSDDSFTFLSLLDEMWQDLQPEMAGKRIKMVSVTIYGLEEPGNIQPDLFAAPQQEQQATIKEKNENMSRALDKLNQKYGRDTVAVGMVPKQAKSFTGTKVAFTRIPDMAEFLE